MAEHAANGRTCTATARVVVRRDDVWLHEIVGRLHLAAADGLRTTFYVDTMSHSIEPMRDLVDYRWAIPGVRGSFQIGRPSVSTLASGAASA